MERGARALGGQLDVAEPPVGLRAAAQRGQLLALEGGDQVPAIGVAHDAAAARVGSGVAAPTGTGGDPHDARVVGGCGDDERVVAVGDDDGVRVSGRALAQALFHRADFADAVELVAREVQVHEDLGMHVRGDRGHVHLVDFEGGAAGVLALHQGGDDARGHVVTVDVGGNRTGALQGGAHHARRRGLAVRTGNDDRGEGGCQFGQELRGDAQGDLSADHASGSSPEGPGGEAGGGAGRVGHARAHREVMRCFRHAPKINACGALPAPPRTLCGPLGDEAVAGLGAPSPLATRRVGPDLR